jgi:hypothetical protein
MNTRLGGPKSRSGYDSEEKNLFLSQELNPTYPACRLAIPAPLRGLVRQRTIPTERPPLVAEVSANFSRQRVSRGQRNKSPRPLISVF